VEGSFGSKIKCRAETVETKVIEKTSYVFLVNPYLKLD